MSKSKLNRAQKEKRNKAISVKNSEYADYLFISWIIDYSVQDLEKSFKCIQSLKNCDLSSLSKNQQKIMSNFIKYIYIPNSPDK